jgi:hypothetical protein
LLKGKNPAQSSWASVEELEQEVVVALGLAGVADDERRPEGGVGLGGRMSPMRSRKRSPSPQRRMPA